MPDKNSLTPKGAAMRARIVASAAEHVFMNGARSTTLDEIRDAVGASKSQIYHYFSDKDDLIAAIIAYQGERVIAAQMPELAAINDVASLRRWSDKLRQVALEIGTLGGCPVGSLANELGHDGTHHRPALEQQFSRWKIAIKQAFERMRANNELAPDTNPTVLSNLFLSTIQGGLLLAKLERSPASLCDALDGLQTLIDNLSPGRQKG